MQIRQAKSEDRGEIVRLYQASQLATGIPDPAIILPSELEYRLYGAAVLRRYVVAYESRIICHGQIKTANPEHIAAWCEGFARDKYRVILELCGSFVAPDYSGKGVWTKLLTHRLEVIKDEFRGLPVSATWVQNEHVKRTFRLLGGMEVGVQAVNGGRVSLFVFP